MILCYRLTGSQQYGQPQHPRSRHPSSAASGALGGARTRRREFRLVPFLLSYRTLSGSFALGAGVLGFARMIKRRPSAKNKKYTNKMDEEKGE